MKKPTIYLALVSTLFVLAGMVSSCSKSSSKETAISVAGTWQGTVVNTGEGSSFTVTFTLKQSGSDITGEFSTGGVNGNVTGTVSGNAVSFTMKPAATSGFTETDTFKGTLNAAATEDTGTWTSTETGGGTFDIKKQ